MTKSNLPDKIGRYEVRRLLGTGGMGEVLLAYDPELDRQVAIKRIRDFKDDKHHARFRREARIAANLRHSAIVQVYDFLAMDEADHLVMEYIPGDSLSDLVRRERKLGLEIALRIGRDVAEGLAYAHQAGIIHRDLKTQNVLISHDGEIKIADFGIARRIEKVDEEETLTGPGAVVGTCRAMSPEQVTGDPVDARSDLFALGVLLYEILTGVSPFLAATNRETLLRVLTKEPPALEDTAPGLPQPVEALILTLLAKQPALRPRGAGEAAQTIHRLLQDHDMDPAASTAGVLSTLISPREVFLDSTDEEAMIPASMTATERLGSEDLPSGETALRMAARPAPPAEPFVSLRPQVYPGAFAGREEEIEDLLRRFDEKPSILLLHADTGIGMTSLLFGGLIPALQAAGRPAIGARSCLEPDLARQLITGILFRRSRREEGFLPAQDLQEIERLSGHRAVLVLDRAEEIVRSPVARERAEALLPASLNADGELLCHWVLAVRREFHGAATSWLEETAPGVDVVSVELAPLASSTDEKEAAEVFERILLQPLEEGRLDLKFAPEHVERLSQAFARARRRAPLAPLGTELQICAAHLVSQAANGVVEVPLHFADPDDVSVETALEDHLERALRVVFPRDRQTEERRRLLRGLAESVDDDGGRRSEGLTAQELFRDLRSTEISRTEILARWTASPIYLLAEVGSGTPKRYEIASGRMAAYIARRAEEERRREQKREAGIRRFAVVGLGLALIALGVFLGLQRAQERALLPERIVQGTPAESFAALDRLRREGTPEEELLTLWLQREFPQSVLEQGLGGVAEERRNEAILAIVDMAASWATMQDSSPEALQNLAVMVWALDVGPGRDSDLARRALPLRDRLLTPLREQRPPRAQTDESWVEIPAGDFSMGADDGEADEHPPHAVTISPFRLLRHEVVNEEFRRLFPEHRGRNGRPATGMDWYEASVYAAWLGGRLPTEAEWEYAARAGCGFAFCDREGAEAELQDVAWTLDPSQAAARSSGARAVRRLEPNPWGLYDMLGNVSEWTASWQANYTEEAKIDPWGPPGGGERSIRGGSFASGAVWARPEHRHAAAPEQSFEYVGLRVAVPELWREIQEAEQGAATEGAP